MSNSKAQKGSRLLSLPGELRNRIYDYCVDDSRVSFHTGRSELKGNAIEYDGYLGFTQTCRQTRSEFRPQYMRATTFMMPDASALDKFLDIFFPTATGMNNVIKQQGHITIPLSEQLHLRGGPPYFMTLAVTRAFQLATRRPLLRCHFIANKDAHWLSKDGLACLNRVLDMVAEECVHPSEAPMWQSFFEHMLLMRFTTSDSGYRISAYPDHATDSDFHDVKQAFYYIGMYTDLSVVFN
ncbi:hypothetical protein NX059_012092 [Plenodomus lindquistii]|nr:hypothetical protein NX059_012092 [Plenodomus lindquistii]